MPFPVATHYIAAAESKLGRSFPVAYRCRMMTQNGGALEIAGEPWFLHPVLDNSDADRFGRTWNDVVRQTQIARTRRGFPEAAVSIADNGCGDRLILLPAPGRDAAPALARWDHETGIVELIAVGVRQCSRLPRFDHKNLDAAPQRRSLAQGQETSAGRSLRVSRDQASLAIVELAQLARDQLPCIELPPLHLGIGGGDTMRNVPGRTAGPHRAPALNALVEQAHMDRLLFGHALTYRLTYTAADGAANTQSRGMRHGARLAAETLHGCPSC